MTLRPQMADLLAEWKNTARMIGPALSGQGVTMQQARDTYGRELAELLPPPAGVRFDDVELDGVRALRVTPNGVPPKRAMLYIHGGGYVHGAVDPYRALAATFALTLQMTVYIPDYRQAPEHQFPTPIEDVFTAYRALTQSSDFTEGLAIAGDSAGGAMTITMMRWAREREVQMPVAGVAISPWANITNTGDSISSRDGHDPLNNKASLDALATMFLNGEDARHPDASPVFADLHGLPPTLVQMGENEVMLTSALELTNALATQRVRVTLEVWPEMFHVWHLFVGHDPDADEAMRNAADFIRRRLPACGTSQGA